MWKINGRAGQVKDDNTLRHVRLAFWLSTAIDTHSEYVILFFYRNCGYENRLNNAMYVHCLSCLILSSTVIALQNCSFPVLNNLNPKTLNREPIKSRVTQLCICVL